MRLLGEVNLKRRIDGRWYLVEEHAQIDLERVLGRPEGYNSFFEGSQYRKFFRRVQALQLGLRSPSDSQTGLPRVV